MISYTVFPHIVSAEIIFFEFGNPKVTEHKARGHTQYIKGRKRFKGGNYMRKYGGFLLCNANLNSFLKRVRKLFKGKNYSMEYMLAFFVFKFILYLQE